MRALAVLAVLVTALLLVAAAGADGDDAVCDGSRPTASERRIARALEFRRDFGLPSARSHVVRVEASATARRRGGLFGVALTPREGRYFARRDHVQDVADRIDGYVRARQAIHAGTSLEDDYPRNPYLLVRFTRDPAAHRAALRRLARVRVEVAQARFSERDLRRLQDRLSELFDRPPARVRVTSTGPDVRRNRVVVGVITRRTDVEAELVARYGPGVAVDVVATEPETLVCTAAEGYRVDPAGMALTVRWTTNAEFRFVRVDVSETDAEVRVGVRELAPNGPVTEIAEMRTARVALARPLGGRRVVDAETGRTLRAPP